jgi:dolichyl-phosphate beta-glucosyltransferase
MNSNSCSDSRHDVFLSLIVPVYNEAGRFRQPLDTVVPFLEQFVSRYEIIYVDDGSTDATRDSLQRAAAVYPCIRVVCQPRNMGKGMAIRTGFRAASGDLLMFSDADFSAPIGDAQALMAGIRRGCGLVFGSRALSSSNVEIHQSRTRETMGKCFNLVVRTLLPLEFTDTQCGFKMFTRQAAEIILPRLRVNRFAVDVEMLTVAWLHGIPMMEVPVTWRNAPESRVHAIRDSALMLKDVFAIRYRLALGLYS